MKTMSRAEIDEQFGMTTNHSNVHGRISFQIEIWGWDNCETIAKTGWHAHRNDAFVEAYTIAGRLAQQKGAPDAS